MRVSTCSIGMLTNPGIWPVAYSAAERTSIPLTLGSAASWRCSSCTVIDDIACPSIRAERDLSEKDSPQGNIDEFLWKTREVKAKRRRGSVCRTGRDARVIPPTRMNLKLGTILAGIDRNCPVLSVRFELGRLIRDQITAADNVPQLLK